MKIENVTSVNLKSEFGGEPKANLKKLSVIENTPNVLVAYVESSLFKLFPEDQPWH